MAEHLHMSEKFSNGTIIPQKTNKYITAEAYIMFRNICFIKR